MGNKKPIVLLILDGFGIGKHDENDAVWMARTPNMDRFLKNYPNTTLEASGLDVGLPDGQMGNSEVGHTNIGAGRVVFQDLPRISLAVEDGSFFKNPEYLSAIRSAKARGKALHILGLASPGGVHSHIDHICALAEAAKREGLEKVYIHAFLDGRDVPPKSAKEYISSLTKRLSGIGCGKIATLMGRFYAMDRDRRWARVQKAYDAMVRGVGKQISDPTSAIGQSYEDGVTDEFVEPVVCDPNGLISSGDSVVFINFRPDRAREITWALTGNLPDGAEMDIEKLELRYICTTQYDDALDLPIAFPPEDIKRTLGEYISSMGLTQLRIAETEKYAHVTFFFNGGVETPFPGEDRILVPSPNQYPTYDLIPEMSAREVSQKCSECIKSGRYDLVICNLANCDMVGHTGVMSAALKAVETVDECAGQIAAATKETGGIVLITADHGNAESMVLPDGSPNTAHTTNSVPLVILGAQIELSPGRLADIAPTMLELMGYEKPAEMTGKSLIR